MTLHSSDGYTYWVSSSPGIAGRHLARAAAGLDLLRTFAGADSEWYARGLGAYESKGNGQSFESGVHALGETLRLWGQLVDEGIVEVEALGFDEVRTIASTDLMEQVRALLGDKAIHPAAPIMLAGAALETALRAVVEERALEIGEKPGIAAYGRALRRAEVITKQDMKDIDQLAGLRNEAAHGEFAGLSKERAGLMEQQTNLILARLRSLLGDEGAGVGAPAQDDDLDG